MFNNLKLAILQALQLSAQAQTLSGPPYQQSPVDALRERFRKHNVWRTNRHQAKKTR
jgi:hypothetical protein